jgi:hypothetical protein
MLVDPVVLMYPNPSKSYVLYTDASDHGLGAVLTQMDEQGEERPVCFMSRKIQEAERRYVSCPGRYKELSSTTPTVEKELLAVVYALSKLRKYLYKSTFTLCT